MRINGKQSDERRGLFSEQQMNCVQHIEHLILLATVQAVDYHDQPRLLPAERIQTLDHLNHDTNFSFQCLELKKTNIKCYYHLQKRPELE